MGGIGDADPDPLQRGIPKVRSGDGIVVLGAPIGYNTFIQEKIQSRVSQVQNVVELLPLVRDPHSELVLLRSCLSLPKICFLLRAIDTTSFQEQLQAFDNIIRGALCRLLGTAVSDMQWAQASLPVAMGGLGLRSAVDHAPGAYAVSFLAAQPLLDGLLGEDEEEPQLPQSVLDQITARTGEDTTVETLAGVSQKNISLKVDLSNKTHLLLLISEANKEREIARMASLGLPHAGNWLSVVPSPALGLHLRPSEFIPAIKYRLGIPVYSSEGSCPACAAQSDRMGDHALGCVSTSDRIARHNMLRDVIYETAASADLGPAKEERHLLPGTSARPGDVMIRRWSDGKDAAIDVTVTSPLAKSNVAGAAAKAGASLDKACLRKKRETEDACRQEGLVFLPFALETLGGFHSGALAQVKLLGSALARSKGLDENEVTSQFFGRLSLCLMRGNAIMLSSRSPDQDIPVPEIDGLL